MDRYVFHYAGAEETEPHEITCGRLTRNIIERYRAHAAPDSDNDVDDDNGGVDMDDHGGVDMDDHSDTDKADTDDDTADSAFDDERNWQAVAKLSWALKSDRTIRLLEVERTITALENDGSFKMIRSAFRHLADALVLKCPPLRLESRGVALQLVAIGKDMATAVIESPDLLSFVKNELQPVDLAVLLQS